MKYKSLLIMWAFIILNFSFMAVSFSGCKEDRSGVAAIDSYFEIINMVVRDNMDIDPERLESIHQIYKAYQATKEKGFVNEKMYIMCAIDICDILLTQDMSPKDLKNIEAARAGLYVLVLAYP